MQIANDPTLYFRSMLDDSLEDEIDIDMPATKVKYGNTSIFKCHCSLN